MWGGRKKSRWGVSRMTLELSASTPTSERLQPRARENGAEGRNKGEEHVMAKWIAAEKARTGLRHAFVCPNVTGRTNERITQSRRTSAGSLALVSSGRLVCKCHDVFLWCYPCFVLLHFCLYAFVGAATLRSIVLRYAGSPIATRVSLFLPFVNLEMSLFPSTFCTVTVLLFIWRVR